MFSVLLELMSFILGKQCHGLMLFVLLFVVFYITSDCENRLFEMAISSIHVKSFFRSSGLYSPCLYPASEA